MVFNVLGKDKDFTPLCSKAQLPIVSTPSGIFKYPFVSGVPVIIVFPSAEYRQLFSIFRFALAPPLIVTLLKLI